MIYVLFISILLSFSINGYSQPKPTKLENSQFGYLTQYGYSNFKVNHTYLSTVPQHQSLDNQTKPKPRRITVYNGQGGSKETPGGNSDGNNWLYRYDEATATWWCSQDGGLTWKKWDSLWGWGLIGYTWREGRGDPTEESGKWHHDPNSQYLNPLGDDISMMITLILLASIYWIVRYKWLIKYNTK